MSPAEAFRKAFRAAMADGLEEAMAQDDSAAGVARAFGDLPGFTDEVARAEVAALIELLRTP